MKKQSGRGGKHPDKQLNKRTHTPATNPAASQSSPLRQISQLILRYQFEDARKLLIEYVHDHPRDLQALDMLARVCSELGDQSRLAVTAETLLRLAPNDPDAVFWLGNLINIYQQLDLPGSAAHAIRRYITRFPKDQQIAQFRSGLELIEQMILPVMHPSQTDTAREIELIASREEASVLMTLGELGAARAIYQAILTRAPDDIATLNNMAQIDLLEGLIDQARATEEAVLVRDPENIHALGTLVHLNLLSGHHAVARALGDRLIASTSQQPDGWKKQLESLAFLGDYAAMWHIFERTERKVAKQWLFTDAFMLHLAAVAGWRMGHERKARTLWKLALELDPDILIARKQLEDLAKPASERNAPYFFTIEYWLPYLMSSDLLTLFAQQTTPEVVYERLLKTHPEISAMLSRMLADGDQMSRIFALMIAKLRDNPDVIPILRDFALSDHGPDELRLEAMSELSNRDPDLPERLTMYLNGTWREIASMGFIIDASLGFDHLANLEPTVLEAFEAMQRKDYAAAVPPLQEAYAKHPDISEIGNNLAAALTYTGHADEGEAMIREIFARDPNYPLGRISMARMAMRDQKLDEAEELLRPLVKRKRWHPSWFRAFSQVQIDLAILQERWEAADTWLKIMCQILPDDPLVKEITEHLNFHRRQIHGPGVPKQRRTSPTPKK